MSDSTNNNKASQADTEWHPFPLNDLPMAIRQFVIEGSAAIGCDATNLIMVTLAVLASAVGTSRAIRLKRTWREFPILWCVLIGKSGSMKSPPRDLALKPVWDRERDWFREYAEELQHYNCEMEKYEAALKKWKSKGFEKNEEQPLPPDKPICQRATIDNATMEAIAPVLCGNPKGLHMCSDELAGWIRGMDAYRGGKGGDAARWLELHRGGVLQIDRKTGEQRHIRVESAAVSVSGTIQPGTARRLFTREYFESGMVARMLLAEPPAPRKQWRDEELSPQVEARYAEIVNKLLALRHDVDEQGDLHPVEFPLTVGGQLTWIDFYNSHASEQADLHDDDLAAAFSKLEGYAARFTLLIHLVRWASNDRSLEKPHEIDSESVRAGANIAKWFTHETSRIYGMLSDHTSEEDCRLLGWMRNQGGSVTVRELQRSMGKKFKTSKLAKAALDDLAGRGLCRHQYDEQAGRGQPVLRYFLADIADTDTNPTGGSKNGISVGVGGVGGSQNGVGVNAPKGWKVLA